MRITDVRAYALKTRTALVRVFTDEGMKRIAVLAETHDLPVVPHQTQPGVGNAATLHLHATTLPSASRPHEYTGPRPDLDELFKEPLVFEGGRIGLPDRPGLGLEIDDRALARMLA